MKSSDYFLVFTAPFCPVWSFGKLQGARYKLSIGIFSMFVTLLILLVFYYLDYSKRPHHLSFGLQAVGFSMGFIMKVLLISVVLTLFWQIDEIRMLF